MGRKSFDEMLKDDLQVIQLIGQGLTYREVAEKLGVPMPRVRMRVYNIKKRLKKFRQYVSSVEREARKGNLSFLL
jgi:DNA-directed RNA polymerase specialized sigma24 family protein